jgi:signal transduction histidine kinase
VRTRSIWRTTTFRLTTLFGVVFALGIVVVLSLVYVQTATYLTHRVDRQLNREVDTFLRAGPESILQRFKQEAARDPLNTFGLFSAGGEQVAGDTRLKPQDLPANGRPRNLSDPRGANPKRALATQLPWGETLIVARDTSQLVELRRITLGALVWSGAVTVLFGLTCGIALSAKPLRRVQAFQDASDAIVSGDFAVRLPVDGSHDELDELARIVNAMVDEVERLMIQARTVGESVAHELRTPLTRLRTTLEHASRSFDDADPRRALLERCVAETEGVLARFQALLRISAVESRNRQAEIAAVSLTAIVEQVAELYQPLAIERRIGFEVVSQAGVTARADADLMVEAVSNLVDNALKFTPPGGQVKLILTQEQSGPSITIADNGPGIPEPERPLVLKRFYRSRRDASVQGHGLGLSLVAAIVDLHGFALDISDAAPGAAVTILCRRDADHLGVFRSDGSRDASGRLGG